ncbi:HNH endonuclease [Streptomyces sp. NPDC016845]|uniref:HNH endonuclease n=1 Tax=Streptomyces sp. NPDC016845 TaxID=3364972 RepID=UPI0037B74322
MGQRYTREQLEDVARRAVSWDEAVRFCGGEPTPHSKRYLHRKMTEAGIDVSHFRHGAVRHTDEALRAAVAESYSIRDVVRRLGINNVGGNQAHIGRRIAALGINTTHFAAAERPTPRPGRGRANILVLRSPDEGRVHGVRIRRELMRLGVAEQCASCSRSKWRGRPIALEVDHLSGEWWDNRVENLRLLCPNCHAVTDTYRGRNRRTA